MMTPDNKYLKGKIYKIISSSVDDVYIGSTYQQTLAKRLGKHRSNYNSWKSGSTKNYISSFKLLEQPDYEIVLIEEYPCQTKDQLLQRERYHIEHTEHCVNKISPIRTKEEWLEIKKKYYEDNKEISKKRMIVYYNQHKQYQLAKMKEYRETHKAELKAHKGAKFTCECGKEYTNGHKTRHMKTQKHITFMDTQCNQVV